MISTHTPLAGRDYSAVSDFFSDIEFLLTRPSRDVTRSDFEWGAILQISTHTPLAGRDHTPDKTSYHLCKFLLTRPSRDVTAVQPSVPYFLQYFYSHAPRGT